jgi:hypothetical protein
VCAAADCFCCTRLAAAAAVVHESTLRGLVLGAAVPYFTSSNQHTPAAVGDLPASSLRVLFFCVSRAAASWLLTLCVSFHHILSLFPLACGECATLLSLCTLFERSDTHCLKGTGGYLFTWLLHASWSAVTPQVVVSMHLSCRSVLQLHVGVLAAAPWWFAGSCPATRLPHL